MILLVATSTREPIMVESEKRTFWLRKPLKNTTLFENGPVVTQNYRGKDLS